MGVVDRLYGVLHEADAGVKRTTVVFSPVELRFAAAKNQNQTLIDVLDYHLSLLKKDTNSIYYQMVDRTLGEEKVIRIPKVLVWILIAAFGLLILLGGMSLVLRKQVDVKTKELHQNNQALMEEIRERRLAEEALRESEEKFRLISERILLTNCAPIRDRDDQMIGTVLVFHEIKIPPVPNTTKIRLINPKFEYRNPKQYQNSNIQNSKQKLKTIFWCGFCFGHLNFGHLNLFRISCFTVSCFEFILNLARTSRNQKD